MIIMEFIKSADSIILRGLIYRFSGSSSDIARCSELRNGLIGPLLSVFCLGAGREGRGIGFNSTGGFLTSVFFFAGSAESSLEDELSPPNSVSFT
jgi:hypothetical protein